jgi:hypothetical protein
MKKIYLLSALTLILSITNIFACDCGPAYSEESLDNKVYSGANYVFYTAEILSVNSAFHLEVTLKIDRIFYGSSYVKDVSKPITVYFDLRSECAILQAENVKVGAKLFITSAYNNMGRMLITNNCDAFFPVEEIASHNLGTYLDDLKNVE